MYFAENEMTFLEVLEIKKRGKNSEILGRHFFSCTADQSSCTKLKGKSCRIVYARSVILRCCFCPILGLTQLISIVCSPVAAAAKLVKLTTMTDERNPSPVASWRDGRSGAFLFGETSFAIFSLSIKTFSLRSRLIIPPAFRENPN